jgi:pimeloyl-ACP methyl ester carboxylesterase
MAKALAKTARGGDSPARTPDIAKALAIMTQDDLYDASSVACLGQGGFHRMVYRQWGPANGRGVVLCVHGLTRNAGDFDDLAAALAAQGWRVVCPDVVGRGVSDRLTDPTGYVLPQYAADMAVLIARLGVERVHWVGSSMGGLIGLALAAQAGTPLVSLVLNDIGPIVPQAALAAIADYVEQNPLLPDLEAAEDLLRERYAATGPLSDTDWRRLAQQSTRQVEGGYRLAYDPAIAVPFREAAEADIDLWGLWDRVACPTLVLRGTQSPVLTAETAREMTRRGPRARLVEIAGGHAPWLKSPDEISLLSDWLVSHSGE